MLQQGKGVLGGDGVQLGLQHVAGGSQPWGIWVGSCRVAAASWFMRSVFRD